MTAKKKNKTNRTRAARQLAQLEPSLTHAKALHLLRELIPAGTPVPDVTDGTVRRDLLTRWRAKHPAAAVHGFAYLACYDGYSLDLAASDGPVEVHDLGSTEDDPDALAGLPAAVDAGQLWLWFENETYAADCYQAGSGVDVVSYDWSLLEADMRSPYADASYLHDRMGDAHADAARFADAAPQVRIALLTDALSVTTSLVRTGGTPEVRATAERWLTALTSLRDDAPVLCRHCGLAILPCSENDWSHAGTGAAHCAEPLAGGSHYAEPTGTQPCEVDDCGNSAAPCPCGAAHCATHPHVP